MEGVAVAGSEVGGAIPTRNPMVTMAAATKTRNVGVECVWKEEIKIVRGRTRPLAIWKAISNSHKSRGAAYLEERRFDAPQAEGIEDETNNINGHHGKEFFGGIHVKFRYFHLRGDGC